VSGSDDLEVLINAEGVADAPTEILEAAVRTVLADQEVAAAEISVTLLDDAGITSLNQRYLGEDRPTDVIAFTLGDEPKVLGDVYIGADQARRQAGELGVALGEELVRLAIHGALHVLGHDHPDGEERAGSPMFALQERLVRLVMGGRSGA
jgi:probable rRNA maturation factor